MLSIIGLITLILLYFLMGFLTVIGFTVYDYFDDLNKNNYVTRPSFKEYVTDELVGDQDYIVAALVTTVAWPIFIFVVSLYFGLKFLFWFVIKLVDRIITSFIRK